MPARGFFVSGTDTGVGKTLVAGLLAAGLAARGVNVGVMKPLESGCRRENGRLVPQDALFLKEMAGADDDLDLICPYRLEKPLAPGIAAEQEGVKVDLSAVARAYAELARRHEAVIVEGAGGLLVPVTPDLLAPYLIRMLDLPLLVIARARLGTINHTLLTVNEAGRWNLEVLGVVVNHTDELADPSAATNPQVMKRFLSVPIIGIVPYLDRVPSPEEAARIAARVLDLDYLLSRLAPQGIVC